MIGLVRLHFVGYSEGHRGKWRCQMMEKKWAIVEGSICMLKGMDDEASGLK